MERLLRAAGALGIRAPRLSRQHVRYILAWVLLGSSLMSGTANAAGALTAASVTLSDPRQGVASSYTFAGSSVDTTTAILCVKVVWSTTATGDTAPTGFSGASGSVTAGSSTLINSSATNWSLAKSDGTSSSGQNNIYQYTNSASGVTPASASGRTFILGGITNPSTPDTAYYFKINTYNNTDCSTSPIDHATVQFINTNGSTMSMTIDSTLAFTVNAVSSGATCGDGNATQTSTANTLDFGSVTSASNGRVCQDLQASTNASSGYTIFARYTGALTNGTAQTIADIAGAPNSLPVTFPSATEAYGYTTNDQSLSNCSGSCNANRFYNGTAYKYAAMTTSNAEVGYESTGVTATTYRVGHEVGVTATTHPGTYTTTVIYTCVPVY